MARLVSVSAHPDLSVYLLSNHAMAMAAMAVTRRTRLCWVFTAILKVTAVSTFFFNTDPEEVPAATPPLPVGGLCEPKAPSTVHRPDVHGKARFGPGSILLAASFQVALAFVLCFVQIPWK
ncbi:hypothetical protein B0T17DRAFT_509754 [Bombardia bombarda]|uniref:Uncharacterized protein n=1 Tax=Bombardia bombarda TaxID=252184 RepID=A0AA39WML8_9PEZI|nr:hypothetical protein B0T17DRAFT_509754 [Bombardia bombarda]